MEEQFVTMVENRKLREVIHNITSGCVLTKSEYMRIIEIVAEALDRAINQSDN